MPICSVLMPVFNAEPFVASAIASILNQTHGDFELVVINDGSTDDSLNRISAACAGDARCRIVTRENRGVTFSRNQAVGMALGSYVACMDADDVAHPHRLRAQVRFLDSHPEHVAVGSQALMTDSELWPIGNMIDCFTHAEIDGKHMRCESAICNPSVMIRKDAIVSVGGYDADYEYAEDFELFLRLGEIGRLANLPETLMTYRLHLSSVGHSKRDLQVLRTTEAVRAATQRRLRLGSLKSQVAPREASVMEHHGGIQMKYVAEVRRRWAWLSLIGGYPRTARKHAFGALVSDPLNRANFKLLLCSLRGY